MDLQTVKDQFYQVVEKQELSTTKYRQLIDKVTNEINQAITDLQSADHTSDVDHKPVIEHLRDKLNAYSLQEQLKMLKNDINDDLSNYSEILDKSVETDISNAYNVEFDSNIVNQTILPLIYREGLFDVADIFIIESQVPDIIPIRSQFFEMHQILDALEARNLEPAVNWMLANRQKLDQRGSFLEFDLRRLQFLGLLEENQLMEALNFAKVYISPLASNNWVEFLNLMGCLLWPGSKLQTSPYSDLLSPEEWVAVGQELMFDFCDSIGVSFKNPLAVTVDAGAQALPTYLKFGNTAVNEEEGEEMWENPVAVELGREFQFHSVFFCPVMMEQNDPYNPVVILPCGHLFCLDAIWKLTHRFTRMFKCPTCRLLDVSVAECWILYL